MDVETLRTGAQVMTSDVGLEAALRDVDGSCRDLNFDNATWAGVSQLLSALPGARRVNRSSS